MKVSIKAVIVPYHTQFYDTKSINVYFSFHKMQARREAFSFTKKSLFFTHWMVKVKAVGNASVTCEQG